MAEAEDEVEPESERHLPEALMEKIVAKVPFPQILKARVLSKEWKSKLFRVVWTEASSRSWPEFPAQVCKGRVEGYDAAINCVKTMGIGNIKVGRAPDSMVAACGNLLVSLDISKPQQPMATVLSLLTCQGRKIICPKMPPNHYRNPPPWPILNPNGPDQYELVVWSFGVGYFAYYPPDRHQPPRTTLVKHYDSRSRTWTEISFQGEHEMPSRFGAFLDGNLYCISEMVKEFRPYYDPRRVQAKIIRFDTRNEVVSETAEIELDDKIHGEWVDGAVVRCGSKIMAVTLEKNLVSQWSHVKIFELDTGSFALTELSRTPVDMERKNWHWCRVLTVFASTNRVHILQRDKRTLTTYAVQSNTWTTINSVPDKFFYTCRRGGVRCFVFEPSLNPGIAA